MAEFTPEGETLMLSTLFKNVGTELCLAVNSDLDELTDGAYSRADLSTIMDTVTDGAVQNGVEIIFDTGSETATWWFVSDDQNDPIVFGPLPNPQTGEFRFPEGAIRFEAISG